MSAQNLSDQSFYDEVQEIVARYPDPRSASLPALRLAQERHGYLTPDALRETADALVADMIAIVGSLDTVMGEVDR